MEQREPQHRENDLHLLNEQLLISITALRSQNDQLWRIIEMQRATIIQLQEQLQQQKQQPESTSSKDENGSLLATFLPPATTEFPSATLPVTATTLEKETEMIQDIASSNTGSDITKTTPEEVSTPAELTYLDSPLDIGLPEPITIVSPLMSSFRLSLEKIVNDFDEPTASPTDVDEEPTSSDVVPVAYSVSDVEEHPLATNTDFVSTDSPFWGNLDVASLEREGVLNWDVALPEGIVDNPITPSQYSSSLPTPQKPTFSSSPSTHTTRKTFSVFIPPPAAPPPHTVLKSFLPSTEPVANESSPPRPSVHSGIDINDSKPPVPVSETSGSPPPPPPNLYHKLSGASLPTPPTSSAPPQLPPRSQQHVSSQPQANPNTDVDPHSSAPPQLPPRSQQHVSSQPQASPSVHNNVNPNNTDVDRGLEGSPRGRSESEPGKTPTPDLGGKARSRSSPALDNRQSSSPVLARGLSDPLIVRVVGSTIKVNEKGREVLAFTFDVFSKRTDDNSRANKDSSSSRTSPVLWRFEKFYSDFLAFDAKIKPVLFEISVGNGGKIGTGMKKKLPDKSLFNNCAPNKVDQRKAGLEEYLCWVLSIPALRQDYAVKEFLSSGVIPPASSSSNGASQGDRTEGYLTKRGKSFGKWKTRYFVIRDGLLHYYENKGGDHLGTVGLRNSKIGKQQTRVEDGKDKETGYRHAFIILEPKRAGISKNNNNNNSNNNINNNHGINNTAAARHVLCADSDEIRDEWVTTITKIIEGKPLIKKRGGKGEKKTWRETTTPPKEKHKNEHVRYSSAPSIASQSSILTRPFSMSSVQSNSPQNRDSAGSTYSLPRPSKSRRQAVAESSATTLLFDEVQSPAPQHAKLRRGSENAVITGPIFVDRSTKSTSSHTNSRLSVFNPPPGMLHGDRKNHHQHTQRQAHREGPSIASDAENSKVEAGRLNLLWGNKKENKPDLAAPAKPASSQNLTPDTRPLINPKGGVVFGVPLEQAIARARVKEGYELPAVVYRAIEYLEAKNAYQEEGLYRLSGSTVAIRQLKERYNNKGDFDLVADTEVYHDVHAVASLLKLYLRELPASVLTNSLQPQFLQSMDLLDRRDRIKDLARLVSLLPLANYTLLRALVSHLIKVVSNSAVNKMTIRNVGIVFAPTLRIPAGMFALLISEFEYIFWVGDNDETEQRTTEGSKKAVAKPVSVGPPAPSVRPNSIDTIRESADVTGAETERQRKVKVRTEKETRIEAWVIETEPENDIEDFDTEERNKRNSSSFMLSAPAEVVEREKRIQNVSHDDGSGAEDLDDLTIEDNTDVLQSDDAIDQLAAPSVVVDARALSPLRQSGDMYSLLTMYGDFNGAAADVKETTPVDLELRAFDTTTCLPSPVLPLTVRNGDRDSSGSDASRLLMYAFDKNDIAATEFEDKDAVSSGLIGEDFVVSV